jgi:hypothetical protein
VTVHVSSSSALLSLTDKPLVEPVWLWPPPITLRPPVQSTVAVLGELLLLAETVPLTRR